MTAAEYKATREPLGTQTEVAAMLGVNRVTVAKRENGTMTITNEAVLAIQSLRRPRRVRKSENAELHRPCEAGSVARSGSPAKRESSPPQHEVPQSPAKRGIVSDQATASK